MDLEEDDKKGSHMNPHYADGSVFSPAIYEPAKPQDLESLKKTCQKLWIGLSLLQDEQKKGGDVSGALDYLKRVAKEAATTPCHGLSFAEIGNFAAMLKMMVKRPEPPLHVVMLKTRINGREAIHTEDHGGNIGPVVEPEPEETQAIVKKVRKAVNGVLNECKDVREEAR